MFGGEEALMSAMDNSDMGKAKKLSRSVSVIHSENVKFTYEYEVPFGTGTEEVYISG